MNELQERQGLVDAAADTLVELLEWMADYERLQPDPAKWDEEYAAHAVDECLDRLFCAPDAGMPKPSDRILSLYQTVREKAAPFLDEDVPLPCSLEEDARARALALYAERWPELGDWDDLDIADPIRLAIYAEAARDAKAERALYANLEPLTQAQHSERHERP